MRGINGVIVGLAAMSVQCAFGQDAARGAALYMRAPDGASSCVSCHGADPGANPNNILRAADNPGALTRALATVGVMGFLKSRLNDTEVADLSAFLGGVARYSSPSSALQVWPLTLEFGRVEAGTLSAPQVMTWRNRSAAPLALTGWQPNRADVTLTHDCGPSLAPGAQCEAQARWAPTAAGLVQGAITLQSETGAVHAGLSGAGAEGPTSLLRWRDESPTLRFSAAPAAVTRQTVWLDNPGPLPVELGITSIVGPDAPRFRVAAGCARGAVLQAGTACELALEFTASRLPQTQATLQLRGDGGNPATLQLKGTSPAVAETLEPAPLPVATGGGCSVGPPAGRSGDGSLLAWLLAASLALAARRHRR